MLPVLIAALVVVLSVVIAGLMSAADTASSLVSPGRVLRLVDSERPGAVALDRLLTKGYRLRAATALAAAVASVAASIAAAWVFHTYSGLAPLTSAIAGGAVAIALVFSFALALPRTLAVQNPENVALAFASAALRVTGVLYLPARMLGWPWAWAMRLTVGDTAAHSAWLDADTHRLTQPDVEAGRGEVEEALFVAVSDFAEKVVREVMVPRTDMTCIPDTATARDAIAVIRTNGYSRVPVYHERLDDIVGVLYAKDLLAALIEDPAVRPAAIVRRAYFVPETKPVPELLVEMRERTHIAIVADEYGGTSGLVTIEDLLEEIVGEIQDEYDLELPLVSELGADRYRVDARLPVDDLNERFGTAIESESDTVGGVVAEAAGRIPAAGDSVEIEGLRFTVESSEGTRLRQLIVEPAGQNNDKEGHHA